MARHLFFAITLMGIVGPLNSPAAAVPDAAHCENTASNCIGRCANPGSGANDSRCINRCDRQVTKCLVRSHAADPVPVLMSPDVIH
jgi:hypothetical protein